MTATIFANGGQPYIAGQMATTLYIASGSIVDWVYGDRAITSLTIELRDTGTTGFVLPPEQIRLVLRMFLLRLISLKRLHLVA